MREDVIKTLVNKFLSWQLPETVCSDLCATKPNYAFTRTGTNLLTAGEARQMIEHLLGDETTLPSSDKGRQEGLEEAAAIVDATITYEGADLSIITQVREYSHAFAQNKVRRELAAAIRTRALEPKT